MIFTSLAKFRKKPTKEMTTKVSNLMNDAKKEGVKFLVLLDTWQI